MANGENNQTPGLRKQTVISIEGPGGVGDSMVDKTEDNILGETEFGETTHYRFRHADGCGHVIHTATEVGAISACGRILCTKCAENICFRCGRAVCGQHLRRVRVGDEERIYCHECSPWWSGMENWQTPIRWISGVILILVLLRLLVKF